jgi:hypothetical protein
MVTVKLGLFHASLFSGTLNMVLSVVNESTFEPQT